MTDLKSPPSSPDSEKALISCMMLKPSLIGDAKIKLAPEAFYISAHKHVYNILIELDSSGEAVDLVTINNKLTEKKLLEAVGGNQALAEMLDDMPSTKHFSDYIKIVQETFTLRKLIAECANISANCYSRPEDVGEFLEAAEAKIRALSDEVNGDQQKSLHTARESLLQWIEEADNLRESKKEPSLTVGIKQIDELQGVRPGSLITIAGKSSHGKTALAVNSFTRGILKDSQKPTALIFSAEMTHTELMERLIAAETEVEMGRLRDPRKITKVQHQKIMAAAAVMSKWNLFIEDRSSIPVEFISTISRRVKAKHGLDLVVVDYLQLLSSVSMGRLERYRQLENMSGMMKGLAKELCIPVIQLAQLGGDGQARGSKKIFDDSDVFVEVILDEEERMNREISQVSAMARITKGRNIGTGEIPLTFKKPYVRFDERKPEQVPVVYQ